MAKNSFDISYVFKAIDKFTPVAKKVAKAMRDVAKPAKKVTDTDAKTTKKIE